jgi:hypothetical protein
MFLPACLRAARPPGAISTTCLANARTGQSETNCRSLPWRMCLMRKEAQIVLLSFCGAVAWVGAFPVSTGAG